jgi:hypothetical protein
MYGRYHCAHSRTAGTHGNTRGAHRWAHHQRTATAGERSAETRGWGIVTPCTARVWVKIRGGGCCFDGGGCVVVRVRADAIANLRFVHQHVVENHLVRVRRRGVHTGHQQHPFGRAAPGQLHAGTRPHKTASVSAQNGVCVRTKRQVCPYKTACVFAQNGKCVSAQNGKCVRTKRRVCPYKTACVPAQNGVCPRTKRQVCVRTKRQVCPHKTASVSAQNGKCVCAKRQVCPHGSPPHPSPPHPTPCAPPRPTIHDGAAGGGVISSGRALRGDWVGQIRGLCTWWVGTDPPSTLHGCAGEQGIRSGPRHAPELRGTVHAHCGAAHACVLAQATHRPQRPPTSKHAHAHNLPDRGWP